VSRPLPVLDAVAAESDALVRALSGCSPGEWAAPTGCPPWSVAELAAHVELACGRVVAMLDGGRPADLVGAGLVDAAGYYRADSRFDTESNADRVTVAQLRAARLGSGTGVAEALATTCSRVVDRCTAEPPDRLVLTRHGDAMLLGEFLVTRVVELVVHGLDLALATRREPWSSVEGLRVVLQLFLGDEAPRVPARLGLDATALVLKLTGRTGFTPEERTSVDMLAPRRLSFG
jgi:uncharacterized protein (TIGR03083 family)